MPSAWHAAAESCVSVAPPSSPSFTDQYQVDGVQPPAPPYPPVDGDCREQLPHTVLDDWACQRQDGRETGVSQRAMKWFVMDTAEVAKEYSGLSVSVVLVRNVPGPPPPRGGSVTDTAARMLPGASLGACYSGYTRPFPVPAALRRSQRRTAAAAGTL
ncbi:hypothetical protein DPEC_G00242720 [Dallia pectoralis]|uniref:Uncharacterized protein n=1 Tax=Dallia pectoralis TaxID=75939 RepID=A0ACC2FVB1_DALPE|nr:hypothetical protein DPEC_G00242720 [Dallia pectoralis]